MAISLNISTFSTVYLDKYGYLLPTEHWDRYVGALIARNIMPVSLTEDHWRIVEYLRQYYLKFGIVPPVKKLCRDTGFSLRLIHKLFPSGIAKGACKIAGIPSIVFSHPCTYYYP